MKPLKLKWHDWRRWWLLSWTHEILKIYNCRIICKKKTTVVYSKTFCQCRSFLDLCIPKFLIIRQNCLVYNWKLDWLGLIRLKTDAGLKKKIKAWSMITIRREYSYISWFAIVLPASMCMWRTAIATIPKTFSAVVFRIAETITNVMRQWRCAWIQCSWRFSRSQCGCSFRFFRFRGLKTNAGLKKM